MLFETKTMVHKTSKVEMVTKLFDAETSGGDFF